WHLSASFLSAATDEASLADIVAAWRATATQFKSVDLKWVQKSRIDRISVANFENPPGKDFILSSKIDAIIDASRFRLHFVGEIPFSDVETEPHPIRRDQTITFDGSLHKGLSTDKDGNDLTTPSGTIAAPKKNGSQLLEPIYYP